MPVYGYILHLNWRLCTGPFFPATSLPQGGPTPIYVLDSLDDEYYWGECPPPVSSGTADACSPPDFR